MVLFSLIALYIFCKQRNKKKIYEIIPEMKQNKKSLLFSLQTVLDDPSIPHIAYSDLVFGDRLGTGASCDVFYATFRNHPVFPFPFLLFFFLFSFLSSLIPFPCSFPYSLISFPFEGINGEGVPIVVVVEVEEVEVPLPLSSLTSSPPPLYHCHPFLLLLPFPYSSASFLLFRSSPLLCTPLLAPILLPLPPFSFLSARFIPPLLPTPLPSP